LIAEVIVSVIKNRIHVADESVKLVADNVEPMLDEQSHVQRTKKIIMSETLWVSSDLINSHQKTPKEGESAVTNDWKRRGRIFSVNDGEREVFPAYQFDKAWQPLPVIKEILAQLGEAVDGWDIAAWFHFPNGWLSYRDKRGGVVSVAPKDALDRGEDVVEAARKNRATYVA
jgi:hypothetical protein